jgi:hypothetical protein
MLYRYSMCNLTCAHCLPVHTCFPPPSPIPPSQFALLPRPPVPRSCQVGCYLLANMLSGGFISPPDGDGNGSGTPEPERGAVTPGLDVPRIVATLGCAVLSSPVFKNAREVLLGALLMLRCCCSVPGGWQVRAWAVVAGALQCTLQCRTPMCFMRCVCN